MLISFSICANKFKEPTRDEGRLSFYNINSPLIGPHFYAVAVMKMKGAPARKICLPSSVWSPPWKNLCARRFLTGLFKNLWCKLKVVVEKIPGCERVVLANIRWPKPMALHRSPGSEGIFDAGLDVEGICALVRLGCSAGFLWSRAM